MCKCYSLSFIKVPYRLLVSYLFYVCSDPAVCGYPMYADINSRVNIEACKIWEAKVRYHSQNSIFLWLKFWILILDNPRVLVTARDTSFYHSDVIDILTQ